jgi:RimJ/RimL family protein N-acetyltransferase
VAAISELHTDRLILRGWKPEDRALFARINRDPLVMEHFPGLLSENQSNQLVNYIETHFAKHGFGLWATQLRDSPEFIGFIGLAIPPFEAAFTPCVEIGWRLASAYWGRGLATEGAQAVVRHAFQVLELPALVSFTVPANIRSRRVMEKLGMIRDPSDDFDHPRLPADHPLRRHVLYRLAVADWARRNLAPPCVALY